MGLEYRSVLGIEAIMPVLDEYVVWYGRLVRSYFQGDASFLQPPTVFSEWLTKAIVEKSLSGNMAERIQAVHAEMITAAQKFILHAGEKKSAPPLKEYNELTGYYEEFIQYMRRLERDRAVENSGFDERTGLRSLRLMEDDIAREMERRSRQGNPFSLALIKINNFKPDWRRNADSVREMVRSISDEIKECLRSFDDAYYLGDEFFLLALKHADILGSQSAMRRIGHGVMSADIKDPEDGQITVSSVVSEPMPGDSLETLLKNMKDDLVGVEGKGEIIRYAELSPLQRYIHGMGRVK